ncbi:MAG: hypothetical protein Q4F63_00015 [Clostridia bacterium]|nr:hypothetical protein [Clostridia bacterium]
MINKKRKSLNCVYIDILRMMIFPLSIVLEDITFNGLFNENTESMFEIGILITLFIFYLVYKIYWGVRNFMTAVALTKDGDDKKLASFMKVAKFGSIPMYVIVFTINFVVWAVMVLATRGIGIFALPFAILPTVFFTYLNVIFTSIYSICFLIDKKNKGEISAVFMVINILLQLCFVIDVIDTIYLCFKFRKKKIEV